MAKVETYLDKKNKVITGLAGSMMIPAIIFYMLLINNNQSLDGFQICILTYMSMVCATVIFAIFLILTRRRRLALIIGSIGGSMCITMFPIGTILGNNKK